MLRSIETAASFADVEASEIAFTKLRNLQPEAARYVLDRLEQVPEFVDQRAGSAVSGRLEDGASNGPEASSDHRSANPVDSQPCRE